MTAKVSIATRHQGKPKRRVRDWKVKVGSTFISGTTQGYANRSALVHSMWLTISALTAWLMANGSEDAGEIAGHD